TPERFSNLPGNIISIPNAEGEMERFEVWEASNFTPTLQAKFPNIRAYVGIGIDDPNAYLRFSTSPDGISTMTLRAGKSEFIEPYTSDNSKYIVFDSKTHRGLAEIPFECSTEETAALANDVNDLIVDTNKSSSGVFKTFRLAQSVTGEYSAYFGGTVSGAMAAINNTMTRVNGVFEKDFALNLILIDNNEDVVYTDASSDPYSSPGTISTTQTQLQNTLNSVIGAANYDIGHIFHRTGGGGNAGCIGCICDSNKGRGYTSPGSGGPEGDNFDIDFVAHEMGHQLGANHTFSHGYEGTGVNVEPGSGSTIMGYAGITSYNVQAHSDDYFVYKSILQVQNNLESKACANNTTLTNQTPVVNAGDNYDIPTGTAFVLTGTASDADGDALVYNWEQNDSGNSSTTNANSRVSFTKNIGPNFRSHPHTSEPVRYMPKFEYVLERDVAETESYWRSKWEAVTSVTRVFNFVLTARDNNSEGGQTNSDIARIFVRDAGPFKITNPILNQDVDLGTNSMLVEWDVAGTDVSPINTTHVKISLSTDDGATFTVVAESTPNDGSETITIPTGTTANTTSRIMIEAVDNIYYAVSRKFELSGTMGATDVDQLTVGLYPNPNNGQFFLKANNVAKGDVKITIFNTAGKKVFSQDTNHMGGSLNQSYNVKLPAGVYVISIETANSSTTQKLIIK
ncbi:MAG: reprolysin-like metallopeptidase, partial [Moheibacter sp.]